MGSHSAHSDEVIAVPPRLEVAEEYQLGSQSSVVIGARFESENGLIGARAPLSTVAAQSSPETESSSGSSRMTRALVHSQGVMDDMLTEAEKRELSGEERKELERKNFELRIDALKASLSIEQSLFQKKRLEMELCQAELKLASLEKQMGWLFTNRNDSMHQEQINRTRLGCNNSMDSSHVPRTSSGEKSARCKARDREASLNMDGLLGVIELRNKKARGKHVPPGVPDSVFEGDGKDTIEVAPVPSYVVRQQKVDNRMRNEEPGPRYRDDLVESKLKIDRIIGECLAVSSSPTGWPEILEFKGTVRERMDAVESFEEAVAQRMASYQKFLDAYDQHKSYVTQNLPALESMSRLSRVKRSDEEIIQKVGELKLHLEGLKEKEQLKLGQTEGKLTMPKSGCNGYEAHERSLSRLEKVNNKNKSSIREWFRRFFVLIEPLGLKEEAIKRTMLVNMVEEPGSYILDNFSRSLEDLVHRMINMYDRTYRKPSEVMEDVKKAKRSPDEDLVFFMSGLSWQLDKIAYTFVDGAFHSTKTMILKEKLVENVGEHTLRRVNERLCDAEDNLEMIDIEVLYKQASKWERHNKDWSSKKKGSRANHIREGLLNLTLTEYSEEESDSDEVPYSRLQANRTMATDRKSSKLTSRGSASKARIERDLSPRSRKNPNQIRAEQDHYLRCFLNVLVEDRIKFMRGSANQDIDSEEESDRRHKNNSQLPPSQPEYRMTPEDAVEFWEDIPKDVAEFELQVERVARQKAQQAASTRRERLPKWKRNFEQRRMESARPGLAWQYKRDRESALQRPSEPLPRYHQYHRSWNPSPQRPQVPAGSIAPHVNEASKIEEVKDMTSSRQVICAKCGWEGAEDYKNSGAPPVTFGLNGEGLLRIVPLPNVMIEMGHSTENCPKYSWKAVFPCTKCRQFNRIAFHGADACQESPGVRSSSGEISNAFKAKESPRAYIALESSEDRLSFDSKN